MESMKSYTLMIDKGDHSNQKGGVFMRVHLPDNGGMTMIENTFIDHLMPTSSGDFVKIYLYLMRCAQNGSADISVAQIADALHYTESDVKRAMGYWQKMNCLELIEEPETASAPLSDPEPSCPLPPGTGSKITEFRPVRKASKEDVKSVVFVAESYLGRPLSQPEQETLVYFLTDLGMDIDLIDYLLDYCVTLNHTSFRYIQKVAVNWAGKGIKTVEQARRDSSSIRQEYYTILRALGIRDHEPTPGEREYMDRWLDEYALPMDVILMACRRTILQTGKSRLAYTESILKSWSESGVKSARDIERLDKAHELSVSRAKAPARHAAANATSGRFLNFEPSGTDWNAVADNVMRVQEEQARLSQES